MSKEQLEFLENYNKFQRNIDFNLRTKTIIPTGIAGYYLLSSILSDKKQKTKNLR